MVQKRNVRTVYKTLDGLEIPFTPFSWDEYTLSKEGLKDEYRERGEVVDCPTYTVHFATGTQQTFPHDAKSILEAPPGTHEDEVDAVVAAQVEQWEKYQDATSRFETQANEELSEIILTECLAGVQLPADSAWEERQRKRHIKIPIDPEEKRRHYLYTVLLKSKSDQIDIISTITAVSMGVVKEDDLETVKASFRGSVWSNAIKQLPGRDTAEPATDTDERQLDSEQTLDNGAGSQGVGPDAG